MYPGKTSSLLCSCIIACWLLFNPTLVHAADHGDTPRLKMEGSARPDARLTDLFVFERSDQLVLILCTNPEIPDGTPDYAFPTDVEFAFRIDRHSEVSFPAEVDSLRYGGKIADSTRIREDVTIRITFEGQGKTPDLKVTPASLESEIEVWTGLRDDPFILPNRAGKNIGAIVLSLPLKRVQTTPYQPLLVWATSKVETLDGMQHELAARAARSQEGDDALVDKINTLAPKDHLTVDDSAYPQADVVIFDPRRETGFPNGRELADDVVAILCVEFGECRLYTASIDQGGLPRQTENDRPFLAHFPYLSSPNVDR